MKGDRKVSFFVYFVLNNRIKFGIFCLISGKNPIKIEVQ